jgi:Lrp/AsnC family transcriptional regulator, leucine-responsive regulatory protein
MTTMLDEKDDKILKELKKNARNSTKNISKKVKIPRVTVHDRIKKMEEKGIIKYYTAVPDYEKTGIKSEAFIFVSFLSNTKLSQRELAKRIAKIKEIHEVHIVSGEYDLILKVRAENLKNIGNLIVDKIRNLQGVGKTVTFACFETIKEKI